MAQTKYGIKISGAKNKKRDFINFVSLLLLNLFNHFFILETSGMGGTLFLPPYRRPWVPPAATLPYLLALPMALILI